MQVYEALALRRSIRKFFPKEIPLNVLTNIVELSRLYPSGGNLQPVRFAIVTEKALRNAVFADLKFAMYLPDFTIEEQERPTGYIILLRDSRVKNKCDYDIGAASTYVMLAAVEQGLASCPVANFTKEKLSALLQLEEHLIPELVIALGYPAQESRTVPMTDSVRYTEAPDKTLQVPKHRLKDVLVFSK